MNNIHDATKELIKILKTITGGSTYWNNVGGRVFTRLVLPVDDGAPKRFPYLCLPKFADDPSFEHDEHDAVWITWRQPIFGYVEEDNTDDTQANTPELLEKLHQDIIKAVITNPKLNDKAQIVRMVGGGDSVGAVNAEDEFGELLTFVEITVVVDVGSLGP